MSAASDFGRVLVDELARCGVTEACLAPGSRSAPLALALAGDQRVRLHVRIDERSAGFLALGLAKGSGRPVVLLCTSGTAAANFHPAVLEASESGVPILVLTADRPPELRGTGANQTVDQVKLYGPAVRWFCEVGAPDGRMGEVAYWRSLACRAWAEAAGALGRAPGPVHLNLALREPLVASPEDAAHPEPLDGRVDGTPWTRTSAAPPAPSAMDVLEVAAAVASAERGVVVVGDRDGDGTPLLQLAEHAGWPVLAEPTSGARGGDQSISTYHSLLADPAFTAAHRPDFALVVGRVALSRPLLALLATGVPQVRVDASGAWHDPARSAHRIVVADPGLLADAVAAQSGRRATSTWLDSWQEAERTTRRALDQVLDAEDGLTEPRIARDVAALAPDGALLVAGSSMPIRDLNVAMAPRAGLRVIGNRGASGIDGFVSTAVGAALAYDGPALALTGDLSLLHDQNGLLVGPGEPRPDLVVVVLNNDGGGIFSFLPQAGLPDHFERLFGTPHGVDLADVARAAKCGYQRLERPDDLAGALESARGEGGIAILEARTDRAANAALHDRIQHAVSAAIARSPQIHRGAAED